MKKIAIVAAIIAITAATAANASTGPRTNSLGGPVKQGSYCWITTTLTGAGYWHLCGESSSKYGARQPGSNAIDHGALAGGGGGGGGGGNK